MYVRMLVCVFHFRRDSFPDTARTELVTVTLAENHMVQEQLGK